MNQGPVFRVEKYEPKEPWNKYGIPVEINLNDDRGTSIGSFFPDFPDEPLEYPYFALFLDPANALILRGIDARISFISSDTITLSRRLGKMASKPILTSDEFNKMQVPDEVKRIQSQPGYQRHQLIGTSGVPGIRIGIATFVKTLGGKNGARRKEKDANTQKAASVLPEGLSREELLKRLAHAKGDESWGPVTKNDSRILVRIF
jgi:hypothetical protein